jgi:hypothetical protein
MKLREFIEQLKKHPMDIEVIGAAMDGCGYYPMDISIYTSYVNKDGDEWVDEYELENTTKVLVISAEN